MSEEQQKTLTLPLPPPGDDHVVTVVDGQASWVPWKDALGDDLRDSPGLKDVVSPASLAKQFVDQQKFLGSSIRIPSEEASQDDWNAFHEKLKSRVPSLMTKPDPTDDESMNSLYSTLGRPEKPEDYTRPRGVEAISDKRFIDLAKIAHSTGLTQKQLDRMLMEVSSLDQKAVEVVSGEREAEHAALDGEWGATAPTRRQQVVHMLENTEAPENLLRAVESKRATADTVKWLHNLITKMGMEDASIVHQTNSGADVVTPSEAMSRAGEIRNRMARGEYGAPGSQGYQQAVVRLVEYERMA